VELGITDGENGEENDVVAIYGNYRMYVVDIEVSCYSSAYRN
jgi:hypothetical protein